MKIVRVICVILVVAGLAAFAFALQSYRMQARAIDDARSAIGEVTALTRHSGPDLRGRTATWYAFRVRFVAATGQLVEGDARRTASAPRFAVGQSVPVLYSGAHPSDFDIADFAMLWADVIVLFTIAGAMLATGCTAYWLAGGPKHPAGRTQAKLTEVVRAWREGRLRRNSEFQPLLVALAFVGFPLLGGVVIFVLFAPAVVQGIVLVILAVTAFQAIRRGRRNA